MFFQTSVYVGGRYDFAARCQILCGGADLVVGQGFIGDVDLFGRDNGSPNHKRRAKNCGQGKTGISDGATVSIAFEIAELKVRLKKVDQCYASCDSQTGSKYDQQKTTNDAQPF